MSITKLEQMIDALQGREKKMLVAAYANDSHTIGAVNMAVDKGLIDATLVGDEETMIKVCKEEGIDPSKFKLVHEPNDAKAAMKAAELINKGEGNIIMKGLVSTDKYMRAILNKEYGLMESKKAVLSHVTVMEIPSYHKLLVVGDVAIIPLPDFKQKVAITNYLIKTAHALGNKNPKVAIIAASEQVLLGVPANEDAAVISKMAERGQIKGGLVDGPLALDPAIDKESAQIKKLNSEVAGDADCLMFPNIESGNVFYKAATKLMNAELAAMVMGAKVPAVLSSRGDSEKTKLYSIALAALAAK